MSDELFNKMSESILDGDDGAAAKLAKTALDEGVDPLDAITEGFMPGVNEVGNAFWSGF